MEQITYKIKRFSSFILSSEKKLDMHLSLFSLKIVKMVFFNWSLFLGKEEIKNIYRSLCLLFPDSPKFYFAHASVTLRCRWVKAILSYLQSPTDCIMSLGPSWQNSRHVQPRETLESTDRCTQYFPLLP